tara:strand:- start:1759 stop:2157 length:399 start_codon:yes stop_codon:yes gene_type:complete
MKIKTSELTGTALDWAVAKCEGVAVEINSVEKIIARRLYSLTVEEEAKLPRPIPYCTIPGVGQAQYSSNWTQGGPIIAREKISVIEGSNDEGQAAKRPYKFSYGPHPLIAAMRGYVASKLGAEVEIPEELCK